MRKPTSPLLALAVLLLLLGPTPSAADAGPQQVQLLSFVAPISPPSKDGQDAVSITVRLTIADGRHAAVICRQSPRLRSAILEDLYDRPIPLEPGDRLDLASVAPRIVTATNRALGGRLVTRATVLAGPRNLGGGAGEKLPFGRVFGCSSVRSR